MSAGAPSADRVPRPDARRGVLSTLNGIRGLAAAAVVAWHEVVLPGPSFHPGSGYLAVDLFFVLSGFVLARANDPRFAAGLGPRRFMLARLVRLYPLYLCGLLLSSFGLLASAVMRAHTNWSPAEFAVALGFALLFIPAPPMHTTAVFPLNNPAWSLFFELVANFASAIAWKRLTMSVLAGILAVAAVALAAIGTADGSLDLGSHWPTLLGGFPRVAYGFFMGVLLSRIGPPPRVQRIGPWVPVLAAAGVLSVGPGAWRTTYDLVCVLVVLPAIVWAGAWTEPRGVTRRLFEGLGAASYPMYAVHVPLLTMLSKGSSATALPGPLLSVLFLAVMIGGGLALDHFDRATRERLSALLVRGERRGLRSAAPAEQALHPAGARAQPGLEGG
jgi:peptidoglycan/LPS O-acetylase OafA/YrhL